MDRYDHAKQKADQLDAGLHQDSDILKKDMRSASEIMYQDRLGSVLPEHLRNEFPQQSGGLPTTYQKPLAEESREDRFAKSNELHKELVTKASRMNEPQAGPIYNGWQSGQVETTDKPITANGFHGTGNINEPTNLLVKDYLVTANNNSYHPQPTPDKPKDRSLIHSDEADRRALGLGKNDLTDRPDPNQLQTSTHNLTSAEPLHNQAGEELVKDRPLGAEETKESLGPYLKSTPVQKEYMTMASKKGEDMTLGQKIMDTAAQGWNEAKNWFGGGKKEETAEESGEKLTDKAADTWETAKDKASEGVEAVKEKAADATEAVKEKVAETKEEISKETVPEKSTAEKFKEKAADTWEATKDKAAEATEAVKDKAAETKQNITKELKPEKSTTEDLNEKASETWEATKEKASEGLEAAEEKAGEAKKWANEKVDQGEEAIKDAAEKAKKTVTYHSDTKDKSAEKLWNKSHKRDEKLYETIPDKTTFQKVYEQAYEDAELNALDAKELLEEPHDRAVQLDNTSLHNPIERTEENKNKEEIMQENAETASELLAPHTKQDEQKPTALKKGEKEGKYDAGFGLEEKKLINTGEIKSPKKMSEKEGEKV